MLVCTEPFLPLATAIARQEGYEALPVVTLPHPIGGREPGDLDEAVLGVVDGIAALLLADPASDVDRAGSTERTALHDAPTDPSAFLEFAGAQGWGDGLPLIPPTAGLVDAAVAATGLDPDLDLGPVPPDHRGATVRAVAANAVMAGCTPVLLPVVIAAVRAALQPELNLQGLTTTTHPVTPLVIVHGSVVDELGFNAGPNTLGQGNRANATVGRALRLVLQHIGGARPGETDRATHGSPGKYSYCMAERADSPLETLHARRGGGPGGAVTLVGGEGPHNVNDHGSTDGPGLLRNIAGTMATLGCNNVYLRSEMLLVLSPEHAATLVADGFDRESVAAHLHEHARVDVRGISAGNLERFRRISPHLFDAVPDDGLVPMLDRPEDLLVVVAGGPGKHSVVVPTFGATRAVTVDVERS